MKIRRYTGTTTHEAILKVKMDLGSEALILNTKKIRKKGLLNIFSKPMFEVLAAVDDKKPDSALKKEDEEKRTDWKALNSIEKEGGEKGRDRMDLLENKLNALEGVLHKINNKLDLTGNRLKYTGETRDDKSNGYYEAFFRNLIDNDVEPEIAELILNKAKEKTQKDSSMSEIANGLANIISSILGKPEPIKARNDGIPTTAVFVGPTGVGKTTTIAKIAAHYSLNHKKKVGVLTSDTYRISAVEQLKTYTEIMGIPFLVLYSVEDIPQAMKNFSDMDIILIDTAGRSHKDKTQFAEIKKLIEAVKTEEIFLVLSTTMSTKNANDIIKEYSFLKNYKLVMTKLDESSTQGIILNARYRTGKNLSYVTTGQSVPDDIEIADINKIPLNLMGSIN